MTRRSRSAIGRLEIAVRIETAVVMRLQVDLLSVVAVRRSAALQVDGERQQSATPPVGQRRQELTDVPLRVPGPIGIIPENVAQRVGAVRILARAQLRIVGVVEDRLHGADVEQRAGQVRIGLGKPDAAV